MLLGHRMIAFRSVFQAQLDYALRYGWGEMNRDLLETEEMAEMLRMRRERR